MLSLKIGKIDNENYYDNNIEYNHYKTIFESVRIRLVVLCSAKVDRTESCNLQIIIGTFKWAHDPSEGPYRPFATAKGKHGAEVAAMVTSKTQQQLRTEMDSTARELCCTTFWCYFISAFQGIKYLKHAREYSSKGQDIEARDALLDSKISKNRSCLLGGVVCWGILQGVFVMLLLPFIWIPYLIVIA